MFVSTTVPLVPKNSLVIGCVPLPFLYCNDGSGSIPRYFWSLSICLKGELSGLRIGLFGNRGVAKGYVQYVKVYT